MAFHGRGKPPDRNLRPVIYIALGANLPSARHGSPRDTCEAALAAMAAADIRILRRSRWYRSAPVPASDQPDFVNGVAAAETALDPAALLERLHAIEQAFGRVRGVRNAARILDLDVIDYHGRASAGSAADPVLPHPRMAERAFVLLPLQELDPAWRHPLTGTAISELIALLPPDQRAAPMA
jgi:2-amino-4-hydroxy-6-hydroxymethyldihydropteridine diphosphokinase